MDRREQMREWLGRRDRLGLTLRELSRETGVPVGTLGHWAWKLRQERQRAPLSARSSASFVELVASADSEQRDSSGRIEIVLARGRRVVVPDEVDEEHLARVVRALERC
ncbi:MAG: hypothetical protein HZA53_08130 [Planctomycetes bacterium]|nr:hypothetical protein [Planctomycetota bacterium]